MSLWRARLDQVSELFNRNHLLLAVGILITVAATLAAFVEVRAGSCFGDPIVVTGAGLEEVNGTYRFNDVGDWGPSYSNGSALLYRYHDGSWIIRAAGNYAYSTRSGYGMLPPESGWSVHYSGIEPSPTLRLQGTADKTPPRISGGSDAFISTLYNRCSNPWLGDWSWQFDITDDCYLPNGTVTYEARGYSNSAWITPEDGPIEVTMYVEDLFGNVSSTRFTVEAVDGQKPYSWAHDAATITVPTDPGKPYASGVLLNPPDVQDNCGCIDEIGVGLDPGHMTSTPTQFPLGRNVVYWTAFDCNGNWRSDPGHYVYVVDQEPPVFACPSSIEVETDPGRCYAGSLSLDSPEATDNVGVTSVSFDGPSSFSKGETVITWRAKDAAGNAATCTQSIIVVDRESPSVECPPDLVTSTDANSCVATNVDLGTPATSDNCDVADISNDAPSSFSKGTTTVTWIVTDTSGNSATCTQRVVVEDTQNPTIDCPADVTTDTDPGQCYATVELGTPQTDDNCQVDRVTNNAPSTFPKGTTTVTWTVTDPSGNSATCTQRVTVEDDENPSIICPADVTTDTDPGQCYATVHLGTPQTDDNCQVDRVTNDAPSTFPKGTTTVTWTVTDTSGNSATCTQTVIVEDEEAPQIDCPDDLLISTDANSCVATNVDLGTPATSDNCDVADISNDAPSSFSKGTTTVTWIVTDTSGNSATCTQRVVVEDTQNPTIDCPADVTTDTDPGQCYATVELGTPQTDDNCQVDRVTNNAPSTFPKGTTTVTWTVTDPSGNSATCTQRVTVEDDENPSIICPADVTTDTDPGQCYATVHLGTPQTDDNCQVDRVTNDAPSTFPKGTTTVTWTVTDTSGNSATCTQTVVVEDREPPSLRCPSNIVIEVEDGITEAEAVWSISAPTDNCSSVSVRTSHTSGDTFPLGATRVRVVATDDDGNEASCSFQVVVESQAPVTADDEAPILEFEATPRPLSNDRSPTFRWTGTDNETSSFRLEYRYRLDGGSWSFYRKFHDSTTLDYAIEGSHVFEVQAQDAAGNESEPIAYEWVVDTTPPTIVIRSPEDGATLSIGASLLVDWEASDVSSGLAYVVGLPERGSQILASAGQHVVHVTAVDQAGNQAEASVRYVVGSMHLGAISSGITGVQGSPVTVGFPEDALQTVISLTAQGQASPTVEIVAADLFATTGLIQDASSGLYYARLDTTNLDPLSYSLGLLFPSSSGLSHIPQELIISLTPQVTDTDPPALFCSGELTLILEPDASDVPRAKLPLPTAEDAGAIAELSSNAPESLPVGTTTVIWTAVDAAGNSASCPQQVTVLDRQPPLATGPEDLVVATDPGERYAEAVELGSPSAIDNCEVADMTNDAPSTFPMGITLVTWIISDASGNTSTSLQRITVEDREPPAIFCVPDVEYGTDSGECYASVALPQPTAQDNDRISSISSDAPIVFPLGQTTVTWTVTDASGNTAECTQRVNVRDDEPPTISCSGDASLIALAASGHGETSHLTVPVANDNCGVAAIRHDAPETLPVGEHVITWTAVDESGNETTCRQTATVEAGQGASMTCAEFVEVKTDPGLCTASTVVLQVPTLAGGVLASTLENDAPDVFPLGTTTVTWMAQDVDGAEVRCTQMVEVIDDERPSIACPEPLTISTDTSECFATLPQLDSPVVTDNCGIARVENVAPDFLPVGETVILWTVFDDSGNAAVCEQLIKVIDEEPPVITCPPDIEMLATVLPCSVMDVELGTPLTADNCGIERVESDTPLQYGAGETLVTWTATDIHGNSSTCTQSVIITCPAAANLADILSLASSNPVVFNEDFASTAENLTTRWDLGTSRVMSLEAGHYLALSASGATLRTGLPSVDSLTSARFQLGSGSLSVAFRATFGHTAYVLSLGAKKTQLIRQDEQESEVLADAQLDLQIDTWHRVEVLIQSDIISVFVNNELVLQAADSSPLQGSGFRLTSGGSALADDIRFVPAYEDTTPPSVRCAEQIELALDESGNSLPSSILTPPAATDAHGPVQLELDAPDLLPIGESTVTWIATDLLGNVAVCEQVVFVKGSTLASDEAVSAILSIADTQPALLESTFEDTNGRETWSYDSDSNWEIVEIDGGHGLWLGTDGTLSRSPIPTADYVFQLRFLADRNLKIMSYSESFVSHYHLDLNVESGTVELARREMSLTKNTNKLLGRVEIEANPESWHDLALICVDGSFAVLIDGELVMAVEDPEPLATTSGWLRVLSDGSTIIDDPLVRSAIADETPPVVVTPEALLVSADQGLCYASQVNLSSPEATDDQGVWRIENDAPDQLPVGTTTITWTIIDASGNPVTATQDVIVEGTRFCVPGAIQEAVEAVSSLPILISSNLETDNGRTAWGYDSGSDWEVVEIDDGNALRLGIGGVSTRAGLPTDDFILETDILMSRHVRMFARATYQPSPTLYEFTIGAEHDEVRLVKIVEGVAYNLAYVRTPISSNEWHHLTVILVGGEIVLQLDSDVILSVVDPSPIQGGSGHVRFVPGTGDALIDNTIIRSSLVDSELPRLSAPLDLILQADSGVCYASSVDLGEPAALDNTAIWKVANDAPETFPVGRTDVTWTAVDVAGNSVSAVQTVTVEGGDVCGAEVQELLADIAAYELILADDYETGNGQGLWGRDSGSDWEIVPGNNGQVLRLGIDGVNSRHGMPTEDYVLSTSFAADRYLRLLLRATYGAAPTFYELFLEPESGRVEMSRRVGDEQESLARGDAQMSPGSWHDLIVSLDGASIAVLVDRVPILSVVDSDPIQVKDNWVRITSDGSGMIDNTKIYDIPND